MKRRGVVITQKFFNRSPVLVARELIGKFLVRRVRGKEIALMITEAEAYDGEKDLACHGARGVTARTRVMFGEPRIFYVYLVYGTHYMLNIVTREKGYPSAVLIRGVAGIRGPGRVTKKYGIDTRTNGTKAEKRSGLWFEDRGTRVGKRDIAKTPRIGVDYAGPIWSQKPYRFVLKAKILSRSHF